MRFRAGLMIGFAAGYVVGARAGRERYEQIKRMARDLRDHPALAQMLEQATGVTDAVRSGVANGLNIGSKGLRAVADRESGTGEAG